MTTRSQQVSITHAQQHGRGVQSGFSRAWLAAVAIALVAMAARPAWCAAAEPMSTAKSLLNRAVEILRDHRLSPAAKRTELRQIAEGIFDFTEMAHASLGDHWNDLSGDQREAFARLYTSFIEDAYLNQIQDYSGQRIDVVRQDLNGRAADVFSTIVNPGDEPIDLDFRFELKNGEWKIYDVAIDDVSMTSNYRTQFDRVIREQGFDSLMSSLHAKQMQLEASLGNDESNSGAAKAVARSVPPK